MTKTPIPPMVVFGDSGPRNNLLAQRAFRVAVTSMIPLIGLILGPLAIAMGVLALRRYRINPKDGGLPQGRAAIVVALAAFLSNVAGVYCLCRGHLIG